MKKIGILVIATNKYIKFFKNLEDELYKYFLPSQDVTVILFTNKINFIPANKKTKIISIQHEEWPMVTLKRFEFFNKESKYISNFDYLFYIDVDMKIINKIDKNILSNLVGTVHPGYHNVENLKFPTSNNIKSMAYISNVDKAKLKNYYAGGFFGGSKIHFLKMVETLENNIKIDIKNNAIPKWHDESHLNKFFSLNQPTKTLPRTYCFIESEVNKTNQDNIKIVALDKNHLRYRSKFYFFEILKIKMKKLKNTLMK